MDTTLLYDGGIQTVIPLQVVYLDFDGETTSYRGEIQTIDDVTVEDSGLTDAEIATLIERLNEAYFGSVLFVTERPATGDYSTVYVGHTDAFGYRGLAETVDYGNQVKNDNAFVNLRGDETLDMIQQTVAHEVDHLIGILDHGGEGIDRYTAIYDIISGVTSTGVVLNVLDQMRISSGGIANSTTVNSGWMFISSGGVANSTTVNAYGSMSISSGGVVNSTILNGASSGGGFMIISSGGVADNTTVNSGGYIKISSGGSAINVIWTPCVGGVNADGGAYVTYQSSYSGCYFGADDQLLSQGMTMTDKYVNGSMYIYSGGVANSTTMNSCGSMYISSGGVANSTTVNSDGCMCISSGGAANSTIVNSDGHMFIGSGGVADGTIVKGGYISIDSGGVANTTTVNFDGCMYISSGCIANNTTVNSCGYMSIASCGVADGTTVNSAGSMCISSGGIANSTTLNASGYMHISSGGIANSTTLNASGYMYISSGGTATNIIASAEARLGVTVAANTYILGTYNGSAFEMQNASAFGFTVNSGGGMVVSFGGVANSTTVNGGSMTIYSGAVANSTTVNGGSMTIYSGGVANSTTVNSFVRMYIFAGGVANSTILNGASSGDGFMIISSGGVADNTTVNSGGYIKISSGGSAINVIWTPCVGGVNADGGAYVTYQSSYSGCYFGADDQLLSQGMTMTDKYVNGSMYIYSGGVANNTIVSAGGRLIISAGGSAFMTTYQKTIINGGYAVTLRDGDIANESTVELGFMAISSGGVANSTTVSGSSLSSYYQYYGSMTIYFGGVANITTVNSYGQMYISSGGVANGTTVNSYGQMYISSGGVANSTTLNGDSSYSGGGGSMTISSGGVASNTIVSAGGRLIISAGGSAFMTTYQKAIINYYAVTLRDGDIANASTVEWGSMTISSAGVANSTNVNSYGWMYLSFGGVANNTTVSNGAMYISSGGVANSTTVNFGGKMYISSGSVVNATTVNSAGLMYIFSGGVADSTTVNGGPSINSSYRMNIFSGGVANITTVNSNGRMYIGGVANSTAVNSNGWMYISSGGFANSAIINSGGTIELNQGALLGSSIMLGGQMITSGMVNAEDSRIVFDLKNRKSTDDGLIDCIANIANADYAISISADQAGIYRLADGADGFAQAISLSCDDFASQISLTVNGNAIAYGQWMYSLLEQEGNLRLSITVKPAPPGLHGSSAGLSWTGSPGDEGYEIEYSQDNFVTVARLTTIGTALDSLNLADGNYQWRVRASGGLWSENAAFTVTGNGSRPPQIFTATDNGVEDLFTFKTIGVWNGSFSGLNTLNGETARLTGKNRFADQFTGSNDRNVLWLTDDANGDAFFLDDRYTDRPTGTSGARFAAIDEIRAGGGDDVVDLSSFRFAYEGLTLRGGDGNDVLWANSEGNHLFGDAGNDRLTGGSGSDVIAGGIGNDTLHGGGGNDIFSFGGNWGDDTVEQFAGLGNSVTLWFDGIAEADLSIEDRNGNAIFRCGDRSVTVKGLASSAVNLKFGDDQTGECQSLFAMGAFAEETTRKIYDQSTGLLATV